MAIWPFNRKKSNNSESDLPKEVQDYYQAEKRERVGIAGLLAFGTLVLTVLLAMGLFFGGRWAYRAIVDNNGDSSQVAQEDSENTENEGDQPAEEPEEQPDQGNEPTEEPSEPAPDSATTTPSTPAPSPATTPQTAGDLPNTGPASTTALVATVSAVSGLGYYKIKRPRRP